MGGPDKSGQAGLSAKPLGFKLIMIKYISLILFLFLSDLVSAQYLKNEYPLGINYSTSNSFNLRISLSKNSDFEGADFLFWEMPSFSFAIIQNPKDKSEFYYSLNPLIWLFSSLTTSGDMINSGSGMPIVNALVEGLLNSKFEVVLYKRNYFVLGLDLDYLIAKKSIGWRGGYSVGLKTQLDKVSLRFLFNQEVIEFFSNYENFYNNGLRIDLSYDLGNYEFPRYIYHCCVKE